jgi:MFS family permease
VVLTVGWVLTQWGFGSTNVVMVSVSADRLPESQRGKLAGLGGVVTMLAPITGAALGGVLSTQTLALFLVPGVVGLVMVLAFTVFIREDSSRAMVVDETLTVGSVLAKYLFNPRRFPDFAWNWAGRFLFYIGLTFSTTFTAFFFADKLGVPVTEIGGIVAIAGLLGAVGTMGGALGSGFLSDRLRRRKIFVLTSGIVFAVGTIVMAFAPTLPVLLAGSFLCNVGIGVFAAVDQALVLDVLPERDTEAGRYNAINQFATTIPQAVAPLIAPVFLAVGATADSQNYPLLYLVAAVFTVAGGVLVLRVKGVR